MKDVSTMLPFGISRQLVDAANSGFEINQRVARIDAITAQAQRQYPHLYRSGPLFVEPEVD